MKGQNDSRKQELLSSILKGKIKNISVKPEDTIRITGVKQAPLSYAQNRMWFLHQLNQGDSSYNIHSILKMTGELNRQALIYSLLKIVERHEILRTNFRINEEGEPIQTVRKEIGQSISIVNRSGVEEDKILHEAAGEISKPFDLEKDLLIKGILYKQSNHCSYLLVIMHHIVSDGWSFAILSKELMLFYNRYIDRNYTAEPLNLQYIDYSIWQRNILSKGKMEHQLEFWKQELAGLPEPMDLKVKRTPDAVEMDSAEKYVFHVDKVRLEKIKEFSKINGVTLYMTLLAIYSILLNKYSFQEDIIIGTPVANRRRRELENVIGFFVNTLPIRIKINPFVTFRDFLQDIKKTTVKAFSNQDIPFEYIVKSVAGERHGGNVPMIQTMFVLQNTENVEVALPNVTIKTITLDNSIVKFDLLLTAIEEEQGLRLYFEYKKNVLNSDFIQMAANNYLHILDDVLKKDLTTIAKLAVNESVITNNDKLFDRVKAFSERNLVERFQSMVKIYRDKIAVSYNNQALSYGELDRLSNKLSRYIDRLKKDNGEFIGLCMERSADLIIGIVAILKSGCAYVPLDPDSPGERLNYMIKDAGLDLLIGDKQKMEKICVPDNVLVIDIYEKQQEILDQPHADKETDRNLKTNAYMIYTSGSTGNPKGVIVCDYNVLRLFSHTENLFGFCSRDVWTMFHSVAFDFSIWEIWGALLYGGELVIVPFQISRDPQKFMTFLSRKKVTVLNQTPSAFRQLLQCDGIYNKETVNSLNLRYIIFGGEALDFGMLQQWMEVYGDTFPQLVNMYGITETTVHVTYEVLTKERISNVNQSLIGVPIKDMRIYIMDDWMRIVPDEICGEMYVGGDGVSKGYWNREELNKERFIQNPFLEDKDILYKTGDLACRHKNGDLEYIGRNDGQVKVKGFRIELNEIKEQIGSCPLVKDNIVVLDRLEEDARIVSYLILNQDVGRDSVQKPLDQDGGDLEIGENKTVKRIQEFLKDKLPYYMIPNEFFIIEKFPLTINGKIDYKALPKYVSSNKAVGVWEEKYIQQKVTEIWKKLLHVNEISSGDNFFLLGGHSLLATNLIFAIHDVFEIHIPLKYLFEEPTIEGVSRYIQSKLNMEEALLETPLELEKDVYLQEEFRVSSESSFHMDKILVTGSTGFFGAFLVRRLLDETSAVIYCLVRADNSRHAQKRIIDSLQRYHIYKQDDEKRIIAICGDLCQSGFGMDGPIYDNYAEDIDIIIHNAAQVNFFEPYKVLKEANVKGTREIVKFAAYRRYKPIHFISTLYVHEQPVDNKTEIFIDEDQPLSGYGRLKMGYTQSKWAAEKILELARARGLPVNIYRLGRISGHSKTGACQQNDFLWSLVKGCIEIGNYPDQDIAFEFMPVDYLTDGVMKIINSGELNMNYHLFNRQKTRLKDIVSSMSEHYDIKAAARDIWTESISTTENSARHLSQLLSDDTFQGGRVYFGNDHVTKHVPYFRDGIKIDDIMLKALNHYFVEIGYFPLETGKRRTANE